jgi:replication factor A1
MLIRTDNERLLPFDYVIHMNAVIENERLKIVELKPKMKNVDIKFKIVDKDEPREVHSKHNKELHRVSSARVADGTGIVTMPLWDDKIDELKTGNTYILENGFTGLYRGSLRLKIGRHSEIKEAETPISKINKYHDKSADQKRYQQRAHYYMGY